MKRKFKLIVPSFLAILICALLIAGSSLALFTSEATASMTATSAKVKVSASFSDLEVYSAKEDALGLLVDENGEHYSFEQQTALVNLTEGEGYTKFVNNNSGAKLKGTANNELSLVRMAPGDKVVVNLDLGNDTTNIDIKYRVRVNLVSGLKLYQALQVKFNGVLLQGVSKATNWTLLPVGESLSDLPIEVYLPITLTGEEYYNLNTELNFVVEAVQGNAATTDETLNSVINVEQEVENSSANQIVSDENQLVTVTVPAEAVDETTKKIAVNVTPQEASGNVVVSSTQAAQSYDVEVLLTKQTGSEAPVTTPYSDNTNAVTVKMFVGKGLTGLHLWHVHNDQANEITNFVYDADGYVTFEANNFSEYVVLYNKDLVVEQATTSGTEIVTYKATEEQGVYTDSDNNPVEINNLGQIVEFEGYKIAKGTDVQYKTRSSFKSSFMTNPSSYEGYAIFANNFDQLQDLALLCNEGVTYEGMIIKLEDDIDFTDKLWVPFGVYTEGEVKLSPTSSKFNVKLKETRFFMGTIDGNNHKIINLSNKGYSTTSENIHTSISGNVGPNYGLIAIATGNVTIKNIDISFDIVSEGEQALNCVGIIGQYYSQELTPIAKHYKDSDDEWHIEYNPSYDTETQHYQLMETTITFDNVKTSGSLHGTDAMSVYVGTTYATKHPYTFDDNGVYEWRSLKDAIEGNEEQIYGNEEFYRSIASSNWYAEAFQSSNRTGNEIKFYIDDTYYHISKTEGVCISYAPVKMTYIFKDCVNSANVYSYTTESHSRAAIFIAKQAHTVNMEELFTVNVINCSNSGNVYTSSTYETEAGIVFGSKSADILVENTSGLTNTGEVHFEYTGE